MLNHPLAGWPVHLAARVEGMLFFHPDEDKSLHGHQLICIGLAENEMTATLAKLASPAVSSTLPIRV